MCGAIPPLSNTSSCYISVSTETDLPFTFTLQVTVEILHRMFVINRSVDRSHRQYNYFTAHRIKVFQVKVSRP
jgi:hypothetical protein